MSVYDFYALLGRAITQTHEFFVWHRVRMEGQIPIQTLIDHAEAVRTSIDHVAIYCTSDCECAGGQLSLFCPFSCSSCRLVNSADVCGQCFYPLSSCECGFSDIGEGVDLPFLNLGRLED